MVQEHRSDYPSLWAAIESIAPKIGCVPQTLNEWVKRVEVDTGVRDGVATAETQRVKELEREVKELRRANEILKLALIPTVGRNMCLSGTASDWLRQVLSLQWAAKATAMTTR